MLLLSFAVCLHFWSQLTEAAAMAGETALPLQQFIASLDDTCLPKILQVCSGVYFQGGPLWLYSLRAEIASVDEDRAEETGGYLERLRVWMSVLCLSHTFVSIKYTFCLVFLYIRLCPSFADRYMSRFEYLSQITRYWGQIRLCLEVLCIWVGKIVFQFREMRADLINASSIQSMLNVDLGVLFPLYSVHFILLLSLSGSVYEISGSEVSFSTGDLIKVIGLELLSVCLEDLSNNEKFELPINHTGRSEL